MKKTLSLIQLQHASLFLGAVCAMSHTWAQTSDPSTNTYPLVEVVEKPLEFRQFEKVEITGSAILAKAAKQALPLQIIDRREIERSGAQQLWVPVEAATTVCRFADVPPGRYAPRIGYRPCAASVTAARTGFGALRRLGTYVRERTEKRARPG